MAQVAIPDALYQRVKQRAEDHHRSVEDQLSKTLTAGLLLEEEDIPPEFAAALASLEESDDDALLRAAANPSEAQMEKTLQELRERQQQTGISPAEKRTLDQLLYQYNLAAWLRFKAAALLRRRGRDVH